MNYKDNEFLKEANLSSKLNIGPYMIVLIAHFKIVYGVIYDILLKINFLFVKLKKIYISYIYFYNNVR